MHISYIFATYTSNRVVHSCNALKDMSNNMTPRGGKAYIAKMKELDKEHSIGFRQDRLQVKD